MSRKRRIDEEKALCQDAPSLMALAIKRGYRDPVFWANQTLYGRAKRAERLAQSTRHLRGRPV